MIGSIQTVVLVFAIIFNVVLALFVYRNNPKSATNILFGVLSVLMSCWIITFYPAINRYFSLDFLFWGKMSIFFGTPQALVMFLFADTMPGNKICINRKYLNILIVVTLIVMTINVSPYAFTGVSYNNSGEPSLHAGPGMLPFALYTLILTIMTGIVLFRKMRYATSGREKQQAKFIMIGAVVMLTLSFATILVPVVFLGNNLFVNVAPIYVLVFLSMTAYAIVKHGFLDIRFLILRTLSFLVADFLLAVVYSLVVYEVLAYIYFYTFGVISLFLSTISIVVAILTFKPIENVLKEKTNTFLFRGEYDEDELLKKLVNVMAKTIDINELTQGVLRMIKGEIGVLSASFLLVEDHKIVSIKGDKYFFNLKDLEVLETIFHKQFNTDLYILFEDMEEGEVKTIMRKFGISLVIPIRMNTNEVAFLMLGSKMSGDIYYKRDIELLAVFSPEAGIAIQNAKSYAEVKRFNVELEGKVRERTKALRESHARELEKAESVAKLKDEFVFVAAHELRAPVTAIKGFLELVSDTKEKLPKDVEDDLGEIHYASDHLNQLIDNLLEIARIEANAMKISTVPVDVWSLTDEILKELTPIAKTESIVLKNETPHKLRVMADQSKLKEVFVNLITNGIKYNRKGGSVSVQAISIPESNRIIIEVRDTGYGIPKAEQGKIFQKFFRVSNERTAKVLGTGLGLFLTKMLINKMGGDISFTSVEEGGTTFSFYLDKAK